MNIKYEFKLEMSLQLLDSTVTFLMATMQNRH